MTSHPMFTINAGVFAVMVMPVILGLCYLFTVPSVIKHTDFLEVSKKHLCRFAPLYFVAGPPAVTYLMICGYLSSAYLVYTYPLNHDLIVDKPEEFIRNTSFFFGLYVTEWVSSFIGALLIALLLRWLTLPRFWYGILFLSLAVTALYRTAACRNVGTESFQFQSGPEIGFSPRWVDVIPVVAALALFVIFARTRSNQKFAS